MPSISVYEPPGCCSSGVCGPEVEETMAGFASALKWAEKQGLDVARYNLGTQPGAFVENTDVKNALDSDGMECLPLVMADNKIISKGVYLSKKELVEKAGIETSEALTEEREPAPEAPCCG